MSGYFIRWRRRRRRWPGPAAGLTILLVLLHGERAGAGISLVRNEKTTTVGYYLAPFNPSPPEQSNRISLDGAGTLSSGGDVFSLNLNDYGYHTYYHLPGGRPAYAWKKVEFQVIFDIDQPTVYAIRHGANRTSPPSELPEDVPFTSFRGFWQLQDGPSSNTAPFDTEVTGVLPPGRYGFGGEAGKADLIPINIPGTEFAQYNNLSFVLRVPEPVALPALLVTALIVFRRHR